MSIGQRIRSAFSVTTGDSFRARQVIQNATEPAYQTVTWRQHYWTLRQYALGNGLYNSLAQSAYDSALWQEPIKSLRTVGFRLVEFYASHLAPGTLPDALPLETDNARLAEPIAQLWEWSNWGAQKQVAARWLARDGDLFLKCSTRQTPTGATDRVYLQLLDAATVSELETDERGFVTWIRLDVPQRSERATDPKTTPRNLMHTEVWDKATATYRRWVHEQGYDVALSMLGTPEDERPFSAFGISFVPIVHIPFRSLGETRGQSALMPLLDKMDEANRKATRLAQLLFRYNQATWAAHGIGNDATGRPLPPPTINGQTPSSDEPVEMRDNQIVRLPGTAQLSALVPNLDYDAYLAALNADMREIENDAPELLYYRTSEVGELSGRALRFLLGPAIKRVEEARGNFEGGLIRADQMALTMGIAAGLKGFDRSLGTYEGGQFAHRFATREVIPLSGLEEAETARTWAEAATKAQEAGWSRAATMRQAGLSEADIEQMDQERATLDVIPESDI